MAALQPGLLCIFDADHDNPLRLWDKRIRDGQIKRTVSQDIKGLVLEISSKTPMHSFIQCPASVKKTLGIPYPFFHLVIRLPFSTFFAFDVQVLDDKFIRRRFRGSTVQTTIDVQPFLCKMPLAMESGWNLISLPLHQLVKDVYGTTYLHTLRVALYPNCFLKKVYFSDKEYPEEIIPPEFQVEDSDPIDNYRLKYTSLVTQKRKNSLSYYPDLIHKKVT